MWGTRQTLLYEVEQFHYAKWHGKTWAIVEQRNILVPKIMLLSSRCPARCPEKGYETRGLCGLKKQTTALFMSYILHVIIV